MSPEVIAELKAIAARMPCSSDYPGASECGTTTCEKARLEAIADGLLHGADISWLRPWRGAQSPTEARL